MNDSIQELVKFLQVGARLDLKAVALEHILGLTGSQSNIQAVLELPIVLLSIFRLVEDNNVPIAKDAALCLVNISAVEEGAEKLLNLETCKNIPPLTSPSKDIVTTILRFIFDPNSQLADPCCMILSNLSRPTHLNEKVIEIIEKSSHKFEDIINTFTKIEYNKVGANLNYLGPVLSNLSQSREIRGKILNSQNNLILKLLPFTEFKQSQIRRGGIVGTLRNCCFEIDHHKWLLSKEIDILPRLLLPLAGNEEFDEEINDQLPLDLQYLSESKEREADPDIRCMLIEALSQLCTLRENRNFIRDSNTYFILRELHKWEKDRKALLACENLVDVLIRTESEIDRDNLTDVDVPLEIGEKFVEDDENFITDQI